MNQKVIRVYGIVQGVGFRPFVDRIASALDLKGSVANKGSYVEIFVQGTKEQIAQFLIDLEKKAPERSAILKVDVQDCSVEAFQDFSIIESIKEKGDIFVSPDIGTCKKCQQELYDPNNRRFMHPFINCTACGPRLTILDAMPYDRERTSMKEFPMCPECEKEYTSIETRRYDAQPVCCNDCGPEVYIIGKPMKGRMAITYTRKAILEGKIVAIKGIGGFHLCCDATNEEAVARLRTLKRRPAKPFAVMMRNMEAVQKRCVLHDYQEEILDGYQKPIILLEKKENSDLAPSVAPDNPKVGVMLPYAPVQMLLFDYNDDVEMRTDCFVMTSGNVSGAPICRSDEDAIQELSGFCDLILSHNRKIRLRADDSVMDFYKEKPYMIRRSRGYAPLPVMMNEDFKGQVLAIGGELKNTFCLGSNQLFYASPYVGDMADLRTVRALEESVVRMEELLEVKPSLVACDMHPKYNTRIVAEEQNLPLCEIQHHYAHILSCMAENNVSSKEKVIGVSFDGTGYGLDKTVWGGEVLISDYTNFERKASIAPFLQIGGDTSAKEGWRIALSMLIDLYPEEELESIVSRLNLCESTMIKPMCAMHKRKINAILSTSAGRLFDAVSAILNIRKVSSFEGEASTTLMFRAQACTNKDIRDVLQTHPELMELRKEEGRYILPTDVLFKYIVEAVLKGEDSNRLAYVFHAILAKQIEEVVRTLSKDLGLNSVAFSGGVFQNSLLLELCDNALEKEFRVYRHSLIPPNDGGIALGQAIYAMVKINGGKETCV
ncbi:MAG: carbamoyltransferase HypF [Firmicutes bacterium]|nr:carbamoyltransferase HypF [Bacillota bacterium]